MSAFETTSVNDVNDVNDVNSIEEYISGVLNKLELDCEAYSPYLSSAIFSLLDVLASNLVSYTSSTTYTSSSTTSPITSLTKEAEKILSKQTDLIAEFEDVLDLLLASSEATNETNTDTDIKDTLIIEAFKTITKHSVTIEIDRQRRQKESDELAKQASLLDLVAASNSNPNTDDNNKGKELTEEEKERKRLILQNYQYEEPTDPLVSDDTTNASSVQGAPEQKHGRGGGDVKLVDKNVERKKTKEHENGKKKKKDDRRKRAQKGERKA
jgi:hypothetical protein